MNNIQIFNNPQFGSVRTIGTPEEPWFCATDVCKALGYANGRKATADHVDEGDVTKRDTPTTNQFGSEVIIQMTYVNESGLYALIFGSKLPSAKAFKKWVTSEILPSIRKTGQYSLSERGITLPNFSNPAEAARAWADMYDKAHTLEAKTQEQQLAIEAKDKKIEEDKPKVAFADAVTSSSSCCLIGELAKILAQNGYKIGQNRLFEWLRQHHYLGSKGEYYNMPYQKYIEQGIFKLSQKTFSQGVNMKVGVTTVVTTKGQQYFINKFLSNQPAINFE